MKTKVLALDVYGTILSSIDIQWEFPPRNGLIELLDFCEEQDIKTITTSDANLTDLRLDLKKTGIPTRRFESFELKGSPKEFGPIIAFYGIQPNELLVVGDSQEADINGAINMGARYLHVPKYIGLETKDLFDFRQVIRML